MLRIRGSVILLNQPGRRSINHHLSLISPYVWYISAQNKNKNQYINYTYNIWLMVKWNPIQFPLIFSQINHHLSIASHSFSSWKHWKATVYKTHVNARQITIWMFQIKLDGFRILSWLALPLLRLWADVGPVQLRRKQRLHPRGCLRGWSVDGEWRSAMVWRRHWWV